MESVTLIARQIEGRMRQALGRHKSVLLLGPRQTGKTTLLQQLQPDVVLNFLRPEVRQRYERSPQLLGTEVEALAERTRGRKPLIALDEVQRVPDLVNSVQDLVDRKLAQFILTGSSARELRRGRDTNWLPGRLAPLRLDPFSLAEREPPSLEHALVFGSLPGIARASDDAAREEDFAGTGALQLTRNQQADILPGWWNDGRTVVFTTLTETNRQTLRVSVDGTAPDERLFEGTGVISESGNFLFVNQAPPGSNPVRGYVALTNAQRRFVPFPEPFQRLRALKLSPDDRLLAYDAEERGRNEVCLVDFPGFTNKTILSRGGGHHPQWNPNGRELFYLTGDGRQLVSRKLNPEGSLEEETKVFDLPESFEGGLAYWPNTYTAAHDGNRFLMLQKVRDEATPERVAKSNVRVVMNWFEEFRRKK